MRPVVRTEGNFGLVCIAVSLPASLRLLVRNALVCLFIIIHARKGWFSIVSKVAAVFAMSPGHEVA